MAEERKMEVSDFAKEEEQVLAFWDKERIFEQSLEQTKSGTPFVFYEGPPTANGKPGIHHVLARVFKDLMPRFQTMRGRYVARKAGWDTHGLPVELEVEKRLGLKSKRDIENLVPGDKAASIAAFNTECKKSVWTYLEDWRKLTKRMAYWIDLAHPYVTYETPYMETLWHIIKTVFDKGLLKKTFRIQPFCTRCGTGLSSHELALGYEIVEDTAVFVKFSITNFQFSNKFQVPNGRAYLLSWTTTPWTLPGNVALAVNNDAVYCNIKYQISNIKEPEILILAKNRLEILEGEYEILSEFKGSDLVGLQYAPLFDIPALRSEASYRVYAADFVTMTEGTGIVHTAVMYGEDDFTLGEQVGLPKVHTVNEDGTFNELVPGVAGLPVKTKETEATIFQLLGDHVLRTEPVTHEYPFCWRCRTPLLYMARTAWVIEMSKLRKQLIANNEQITWEPEHIKEGRFGEWLKEAKDWTFSRERYWGTPLPIWECDKCGATKAVGSIDELRSQARGHSAFFFVRHGESTHNLEELCGPHRDTAEFTSHLTDNGRQQAENTAAILKEKGIDLIISSPLARAYETAEIIARATGASIHTEPDLIDINPGIFAGKKISEDKKYLTQVGLENYFYNGPPQGESWAKLRARVVSALKRLSRQYEGKRIVIVSHGDPLLLLRFAFEGRPVGELFEVPYPMTGGLYEINAWQAPFNNQGELDLHRPYIDAVTFPCERCGGVMRRAPYVCDVWFDSGSMPFAQNHWPFNQAQSAKRKAQKSEKLPFPADYISEAVDQTRGWFYTLLAVSTLLGKGTPFKSVVCLGLILDAKGEKMSKSKGNIVDPWQQIATYGIDPIRWYLFTVNEPGLPKRYDEQALKAHFNQFFILLWNTFRFLELYAPAQHQLDGELVTKSKQGVKLHRLDQWILARTRQLVATVTAHTEALQITAAARAMETFVDDLSRWYVRRSRDRIQSGVGQSRSVLASVLVTFSTVMAPYTPIFSERLYQGLRPFLKGAVWPVSVHLMPWPKLKKLTKAEEKIVTDMRQVRQLVAEGLQQRAAAGLKVRQPLAKAVTGIKLSAALAKIVAEELNVKKLEVRRCKLEDGKIKLDTKLTPELITEGHLRELVRAVQQARRDLGFTPKDTILVTLTETPEVAAMLTGHRPEFMAAVRAKTITTKASVASERTVKIGQSDVRVQVEKAYTQ